MRALTVLVATLALSPLAARPAAACSPPPSIWTLGASYPAADALDVPTDIVVIIRGVDAYGGAYDFDSHATLEVSLDDMPVDGERLPAAFGNEALWRPEAPLTAGATYTVHVVVQNEDAEWFGGDVEGETERTFAFTAGAEAAAPATEASLDAVAAEAFVRPIEECADEFEGACYCQDVRVVGEQVRLKVRATLGVPAHPLAETAVLGIRVGPSVDAVSAGPVQAGRVAEGQAQVAFAYDLGLRDAWSSDEVCVGSVLMDPRGARIDGPVTCQSIAEVAPTPDTPEARDEHGTPNGPADTDGPNRLDDPDGQTNGDTGSGDSETSAGSDGGCDATGSAPAPLWLALLLPVAAARRRRRA